MLGAPSIWVRRKVSCLFVFLLPKRRMWGYGFLCMNRSTHRSTTPPVAAPKGKVSPVSTTELPSLPELEPLFPVAVVAKNLSRSVRWVKDQVKARGLECTLIGNRIHFTREQYDALVDSYIVVATPPPVTTGRKRS